MYNSSLRKLALTIFIAATLCESSLAVTINLTAFRPDFGPKVKSPCPRGDVNDVCTLKAYLYSGLGASRNCIDPIFSSGWRGFLATHPGWTLVNGGALQGKIDIYYFKAFNDCPNGGGVEIYASFKPAANDPTQWVWAQALNDNYRTGEGVPPHAGPPVPPIAEMDGKRPPSYAPMRNGDFYDKPTGFCIHNSTTYFHAVTLVAQVLPLNKRLITYEGFEWGWDYTCVHTSVPEPGAWMALSVGLAVFLRRRKWRRRSGS